MAAISSFRATAMSMNNSVNALSFILYYKMVLNAACLYYAANAPCTKKVQTFANLHDIALLTNIDYLDRGDEGLWSCENCLVHHFLNFATNLNGSFDAFLATHRAQWEHF